MTTSTLPAAQVVSVLGRLPAVWRARPPQPSTAAWWARGPGERFPDTLLDLDSPDDPQHQTAFGVALLLDEWERARDPNWYNQSTWLDRLVDHWQHGEADPRPDMIDRIAAIHAELTGGSDE